MALPVAPSEISHCPCGLQWISKACHPVLDIACGIFQATVMCVQYPIVFASITLRHFRWLDSSLAFKYLAVPSRNISRVHVLPKCLSTTLFPVPKSEFRAIGRAQGLRITHDITYRPASGLCLGMSLTFLHEYLQAKNADPTDRLKAAAKILRHGGNETSVKVQAIYEALLGVHGAVHAHEKEFFRKLMQNGVVPAQTTAYPELQASIQAFMLVKDHPGTLRQYVLDDLENKGLDIDPDLYALILELDSIWHLKHHMGFKNESIHYAITQAAADCLKLKLTGMQRLPEEISSASEALKNLATGNYLLQFSNHTIALVKTQDMFALFEPSEGLGPVPLAQQDEAISQLLEFYGSHDSVSLKVISISN